MKRTRRACAYPTRLVLWALGLLLCAGSVALGQQEPAEAAIVEESPFAPDVPEPGSVEAIREFTTQEDFLPSSVAYVPDSDTVPSPSEILGHVVGAPDELSGVATVHDYFRGLAAASSRVQVEVIGTSEEGREILLAWISDAANLEQLERYREITSRLADPRTTSRAEMEQLVEEGKSFYYLLGGLHSPETGSPEMLMELAYRLTVSERPEIREIRRNLIVLITPVVEVDGRDRQVEWYYRHLRGRQASWQELREFASPPYWGYYAYHDNNRDGMQLTLALTRAVYDAFFAHHPQVVHDLHESVPLLYISSGHGPYTLAVDPVTVNEWTQFAYNEAAALQAKGLPGVWTWGFWDGWWPGYLLSVAMNHNSIGRFYETFGNSSAGSFDRELDRRRFLGKPVTEVQWYRPWPPEKKVRWSLRNNVNFMQAGVLEALHYAGLHGKTLLRNFWIKGERAVAQGRDESPHAWIFSLKQRDARRLDDVINRLRAHRIEVHRLTEPFELEGEAYGVGTFVVRLDQPYGRVARTFLEEQVFPADEPNPPYDDVAWTWPLLYGVEGERIDEPAILEAPMGLVNEVVRTPGLVEGFGEVFLLRDTGQTGLLAARVRLAGYQVEAAETSFRAGGLEYPAGSWIVRAPGEVVEEVAFDTGLIFNGVETLPDVPHHLVDLPRLGVLHTWTSTQDCGWVRYAFDVEQIPYTLLSDDDVKRGGLGRRFDVIVFPSSRGEFARLVHGIDPKWGPLAYTQSEEFPSHGRPNSSPDITGGMGFAGLLNLQEFIEDGGVFVALGNSGVLPVDGGIVRRVSKVARSSYYSPGSELRAKILHPEHPFAYGYPTLTSVFRGNFPLFDVGDRDRHRIVLQFGTKMPEEEAEAEEKAGEETGVEEEAVVEEEEAIEEEELPEEAMEEVVVEEEVSEEEEEEKGLVLSGFARGAEVIDGKPAILDLSVGQGRVVLFAFNPLHRYLNHSDFRWLYNVVLNWNDLPGE